MRCKRAQRDRIPRKKKEDGESSRNGEEYIEKEKENWRRVRGGIWKGSLQDMQISSGHITGMSLSRSRSYAGEKQTLPPESPTLSSPPVIHSPFTCPENTRTASQAKPIPSRIDRAGKERTISIFAQPSSCLSDKEEDEIYGFGYGVFSRQMLQHRQQKLALATQNTTTAVTPGGPQATYQRIN
ncbi:hypothetical protein DBV15_07565 [Temnothorax longispinosus]|uniref:Uncharacterized protein n=1 Tax=Temnothorax longispinosus TaxID=300112 RepID=A0A4S2KS42_9HYME|nr:hypothetical protein DBV15_07565 [Temnothorax longispinosus]